MAERLAKFMARSGVCSRREAEKLIEQKRVTINGEIVETIAKGTTGTLELVARWKEQIYKLTLDVNGGALVGV